MPKVRKADTRYGECVRCHVPVLSVDGVIALHERIITFKDDSTAVLVKCAASGAKAIHYFKELSRADYDTLVKLHQDDERLTRLVRSGDLAGAEKAARNDFTGNLLKEALAAGGKEVSRIHDSVVVEMPAKAVSGLAAKLAAAEAAHTKADADAGQPHVIVIARAGTGKTTTLVEGLKVVKGLPTTITPSPQQKAVWDQLARSRGAASVCFCAFNRSIAAELKRRVPPGCAAMTLHGLGFRAVRNSFDLKPGDGAVNEYRVDDIIEEITGVDLRTLRSTKPVVLKATRELVNLCKMNLLAGDPDELDQLIDYFEVETADEDSEVDYWPEIAPLVPAVLNRCRDVARDQCVDYADMIWLPITLKLPCFKYDLLLVDEAQDLNRCQQALAERSGRRLVFCGDPKQAIYGFAGADAKSMIRLEEKLADSPRGVVVLPLTVTRRCGRAIVEEARKIVPDFEAHPTNGPGLIRKERMGTDRIDGYRMNVQSGDFLLCRVNAPLISECFKFIRNGQKANIQGRDIGEGIVKLVEKMAKKDMTTPARTVLDRLADWYHEEEARESAKRNPSEGKLIALADRYACVQCFCEDAMTAAQVVDNVRRVFNDDKDSPGIRLSSIHKAKGLEAKRVFFLRPKGGECPHPMAKSPWQREQESNLMYVAITRAIEELIYVS